MKIVLIFLLIWPSMSILLAAPKNYGESIITDPSIRRRCQGLIDKRQEKIEIKQRLSSLISKNEKLNQLTPNNKKKLKEKFVKNHRDLVKEQALVKERISNLEETIVRRGCPGIAL